MSGRNAICLYGIVGGCDGKGGLGENIPFEECYKSYKKHIIDVNNADIFIHSWSVDVEKELVNLYEPKKYKFEKQIQFDYKHPPIHKRDTKKHKEQGFRALSKWYSLKQAVELKQEYEKEQGFTYEGVMLTRFDTLFFVDLDFTKCNLAKLVVPHFNTPICMPDNPGDNPNKVKIVKKAERNNISENGNSLSDMWYLSNSKTIDEFTKIYDGVASGKYRISQHKAAVDHFYSLGFDQGLFSYMLYRNYDFELYRWYVFQNYYSKGDGSNA